jgi:hypothetical protein
VKFEEVKKKIIDAEREKLAKQRLDALIADVRSTAVAHPENVEKLVQQVDPKELERKNAETMAAPPASSK